MNVWPLSAAQVPVQTGGYGYVVKANLVRTPFSTAHPRQMRKPYGNVRSYTLNFQVTQAELKTAKAFIQDHGFSWFTIPLLQGQTKGLVEARTVRLTENDKVSALGNDLYNLSFKVEEQAPAIGLLTGETHDPVPDYAYYPQNGCAACTSNIPSLGRMKGYFFDRRTIQSEMSGADARLESNGWYGTELDGGTTWGYTGDFSFLDLQYIGPNVYSGVPNYVPGYPNEVDIIPMTSWASAPPNAVELDVENVNPQMIAKFRHYFGVDNVLGVRAVSLYDAYARLAMAAETLTGEDLPDLPFATFKIEGRKSWWGQTRIEDGNGVPTGYRSEPCNVSITHEDPGPVQFYREGKLYQIVVHGMYSAYPGSAVTSYVAQQYTFTILEIWATITKIG